MTFRHYLLALTLLMLPLAPAFAQESSPRSVNHQAGASHQNNDPERPAFRKLVIDLHLGAMNPSGDLKSTFSKGFTGGFGFGYRIHRFFQLDTGVDVTRGAAKVNRAINTTGGYRTVGDDELFVPVGGRFVLPLAKERVQLSVGGGFAYLKYAESARPGANEIVICTSCGERTGRGSYEMAQIKFFVDRQRHFGIGFTGKVFQGKTSGAPLGTALPYTTKDRWTVLAGTFSLHL